MGLFMNNIDLLKNTFSAEELGDVFEDGIYVSHSAFKKVANFCKENETISMDVLNCISGVDYPEHIEVVYHFVSYKTKQMLVLKVKLNRETPSVESIEDLWKTANWQERECYDLLGVIFTGHPDLTRILLPDDWEGYPLRKDYTPPTEYHGMSHSRENPLEKK